MPHFAKIENNVVVNVIIADQEFIDAGHVDGMWLETTPNAYGGIVYENPEPSEIITYRNGLPEYASSIPTDKPSVRKNYGGIGYTYNQELDAFIPPKPYNSWVLNETTCLWNAPVVMPADAGTGEPPKRYQWDEETTNWIEIV